MQRLELYARNMVDHHMVLDTVPALTALLFQGRLPDVHLSFLQVGIILCVGLRHRDVDSIATELNLPVNQVLAFFNKTVRKIAGSLRTLVEADAALTLPQNEQIYRIGLQAASMQSATALATEQAADASAFETAQMAKQLIMSHKDLTQHTIVDAQQAALSSALDRGIQKQLDVPKSVSVPRVEGAGGEKKRKEEKESKKKQKKQKH
mmetsp:Transcript_12274/g.27484  ORF Transcript_12274/g.27484 Transcript_12274/m.27484 type:complete len:207 (+) Transcript_12274:788-1408(+)